MTFHLRYLHTLSGIPSIKTADSLRVCIVLSFAILILVGLPYPIWTLLDVIVLITVGLMYFFFFKFPFIFFFN